MLPCKYLRHSTAHLLPWSSSRSIVSFITQAFNDVDTDRLQLVGAERLCAEWILKNGGKVRLAHRIPPPLPDDTPTASLQQASGRKFFVDYLQLPPESEPIAVREIDATWAKVTAAGMLHLRNCGHVERIVLDECRKLHNKGLQHLLLVADTLRVLQISNCPGIVDSGLLQLGGLQRLRMLLCFQLQGVRDVEAVQRALSKQLPDDCEIKMMAWRRAPWSHEDEEDED